MPVGDLDEVALKFLRSEFISKAYANWSIDRRIDAYLNRNGLRRLRDDGGSHAALVERVMANIGSVLKTGTLRAR